MPSMVDKVRLNRKQDRRAKFTDEQVKEMRDLYAKGYTQKAIAEISECEDEVVIITCGRKARDFFTRRGFNVIQSHIGFSDRPTYENAVEIAQDAIKTFSSEGFDKLNIVYTVFKTALSQIPTSEVILPVEPPAKENDKAQASFMFEPGEDETLKVLAPKYLETVVYAAQIGRASCRERVFRAV